MDCGGSQHVTSYIVNRCIYVGESFGRIQICKLCTLQIHCKRALCFVFRQYGAAAALSHLATRDIMAALKATVLCVPGSRGEGEVEEEEEVGVERVVEE